LLDEPDNYLDVPGKQWLEKQTGERAYLKATYSSRPALFTLPAW